VEKRIVALFDIHIPYQIPLDPIFEFMHDFKPDIVILGGDLHEWAVVSEWIANQSRHLDGSSIKQCFEDIEEKLLKPTKKACPGAKVVLLEGNHEWWLRKAIELNPNGKGYWELESNIDQRRYNVEILPLNVPFRISNHLVYIHGCYTNQYHARKTVEAYHVSVLYGHVHDVQTYTHVSPVDVSQYYKGQSCGCLCKLNPHFLRNKPNRWVNGFNYCYIDQRTGYFNDVQVYIIDGAFYALGRKYK